MFKTLVRVIISAMCVAMVFVTPVKANAIAGPCTESPLGQTFTERPKVNFKDSYYNVVNESDRAIMDFVASSPIYGSTVYFHAETLAAATGIPLYEENGKACVNPEDVTRVFYEFYKRNGFELVIPNHFEGQAVSSPVSKNYTSFSMQLNDDFFMMGSGIVEDFAKNIIAEAQITPDTDQIVAAHHINNAIKDYLVYDIGMIDAHVNDSIVSHRGVCRHYAKMFEYVCRMCGMDCETVYGYAYGDESKGHAWNRLHIGEEDYYFDVTWNDDLGNRYMFGSIEGFEREHTLYDYNK